MGRRRSLRLYSLCLLFICPGWLLRGKLRCFSGCAVTDLRAWSRRSWQGSSGVRGDSSLRSVARAALRRETLFLVGGAISHRGSAAAPATVAAPEPQCVTPLHWTKGSQPSVALLVNDVATEMMLDTGVSKPAVTRALAERLRLPTAGTVKMATGGGAISVRLVDVRDAQLASGKQLGPMQATVLDSELLEGASLPLDGMLGYGSFYPSDIDIDFPAATLRLWSAGDGSSVAGAAGMRSVEARALPRFGILVVRLMAPDDTDSTKAVGIIDTGSLFSIANVAAAKALGLKLDPSLPAVGIEGVEGSGVLLPQARGAPVTLRGREEDSAVVLQNVSFVVGDVPILSTFAGKGAPAVLLGLDVLSQYRLLYSGVREGTSTDGEQRLGVRLFFSGGGI